MGMRFLVVGLALFSINTFAEMQTVANVDPGRYAGRWYQIAGNPMEYDRGCFCAQQTLQPALDGTWSVYNSCNRASINGPVMDVRGTATCENKSTNAQFEIDFGRDVKGQYWIIALEENYAWAVVSEPSGKALYILSKTQALTDAQFSAAVTEAAKQVDTSKLERMVQMGCTYPPSL